MGRPRRRQFLPPPFFRSVAISFVALLLFATSSTSHSFVVFHPPAAHSSAAPPSSSSSLSSSSTSGPMTTTTTTTSGKGTHDAGSSSSSSSSPTLLSPPLLDRLVDRSTSYAAARGLQVEDRANPGRYLPAPCSLLPQCYPMREFEKAVSLAAPFGILVDLVSRDGDFLGRTLGEARGVDGYTDRLLELYEEIYLGENRGMEWGRHARSADRLGILRSDYMLHDDDGDDGHALKQVELNTIASSFAGLASTVANMHSYLTGREGRRGGELAHFLDENERAVKTTTTDATTTTTTTTTGTGGRKGVPESPAMTRLPRAMAVAYDRYRSRFPPPAEADDDADDGGGPIVLFVVQPGETNTVDQRMLEVALWENHGIPVVRASLAEIHDAMTLDESTGRLTFVERADAVSDATAREVAVVYFRAGYAPTDYPSGDRGSEWLAREMLERGRATKCPNLGYHLAGTKKVQQELARAGAVERFFPDDGDGAATATARLIRSAFAGLYGLGADADADDMRAVRDVLLHGGEGRYVLKPQREGGGYNFYGKDMAQKLRENCSMSDDGDVSLGPALSEFILMERLFPPQQRAILMRNGRVEGVGMTISELGCFGAIVASGDGEIVHNEYAGFLLRTKFSGVDEGGVASGFAALSSPYLC